MNEEIKKIFENAKSEEELLKSLDNVDRKLLKDELEALNGGYCGSTSETVEKFCGDSFVQYQYMFA